MKWDNGGVIIVLFLVMGNVCSEYLPVVSLFDMESTRLPAWALMQKCHVNRASDP